MTRGDPVRVVIGEDSLLLREGIARVLEAVRDRGRRPRRRLRRAARGGDRGRARTSPSSTSACRPTHTDEGLRAAKQIRAELPDTGVLVLSQYLDEDYVFALLGDGAEGLGYLLKDRITDGDAFVDAVRRVAAGEAALDPEVVAHLLGRPDGRRPARRPHRARAHRPRRDGRGPLQPGDRGPLFLSDRAVERHVTAIFTKLGLDAPTPRERTAACSRC